MLLLMGFPPFAGGQALTPAEIKQPQMRALQERYFNQLQTLGAEVQAHVFPYSFYFSRILDVQLAQQERVDQRSLRFDNYSGLTVVELTGNYFVSYSSETVDKNHRTLRTFQDVMLPILEIAVPMFKDNPDVEGFAMEISHHVRGKAMGMNIERAENLVLVMSTSVAQRLVTGKSESERQAALLDGQFFVNAEPFTLYLSDRAAEEGARLQAQNQQTATADAHDRRKKSSKSSETFSVARPPQRPIGLDPPPPLPRDISPENLATIQSAYQPMIETILKEMNDQAHFVSYAPPVTIPFRRQAYLEFSVNTTVAIAAGTRYQLAALAFDEHISRLIRPLMAHFKGDVNFDGIAFSTTIHSATQKDGSNAFSTQGSEAVEFFFPITALRSYETYDCSGQQLIDEGAVLINGERVTLDLQIAEAGAK